MLARAVVQTLVVAKQSHFVASMAAGHTLSASCFQHTAAVLLITQAKNVQTDI